MACGSAPLRSRVAPRTRVRGASDHLGMPRDGRRFQRVVGVVDGLRGAVARGVSSGRSDISCSTRPAVPTPAGRESKLRLGDFACLSILVLARISAPTLTPVGSHKPHETGDSDGSRSE